MCHGRSWTLMDLAAQRLCDKAWRKHCAARLEASCPWIVHVSSMVYTRPYQRQLNTYHCTSRVWPTVALRTGVRRIVCALGSTIQRQRWGGGAHSQSTATVNCKQWPTSSAASYLMSPVPPNTSHHRHRAAEGVRPKLATYCMKDMRVQKNYYNLSYLIAHAHNNQINLPPINFIDFIISYQLWKVISFDHNFKKSYCHQLGTCLAASLQHLANNVKCLLYWGWWSHDCCLLLCSPSGGNSLIGLYSGCLLSTELLSHVKKVNQS